MGDWKRGESKQMTPWEGKGQVPKKKASVWDRPGLQSGGRDLEVADGQADAPARRWGERSARFAPGGATRRHPPAPLEQQPAPLGLHLARPRLLLRPGGARCPSASPWLQRELAASWRSPLKRDGGARPCEESLKGCHPAIA